MKKLSALIALLAMLLSPGLGWGQGNESFTNLPTSSASSYLARTWTGDNSVTWTAEGARTDQTLTGKAICWGNSGTRNVISPSYSGGMGTLTFNYVRAFTGASARSLEVYVNSVKIGSTITVNPNSDVIVQFNSTINVSGSVILEIRSTGAAQVKVDDISWTSYTAATPTISLTPTSLSGFTYAQGSGPSTEQTFTVSGSSLTADISIAASTNYEISKTSGSGYTTPLTFTPAEVATPQTVYVRLKSGLAIGNYNSEEINLTSTGATPKTVTCSGSVIDQIDWANMQWPPSGTVTLGDNYNVYARVYAAGVTDAVGQGAGISCWIGYSTSNTDPSTWTNWVVASFQGDDGPSNDEYVANIGADILSAGTYYYASRFQLGTAPYIYGGYNSGFWDGTTNVSGTLTVNAPTTQIDWANLQWPENGSISAGGDFNVYAQVYEPIVTNLVGQGAGITAWIGYSDADTDPSTWTNWVEATFNADAGNNDEYTANIGAVIPAPGTYYYASRFRLGLADYVYGGFNGGFWDGTSNVSGELTITIPFMIINEVDSDTPGTDAAEFIELYDGGVGNTPLDGFVVVLYNGSNDLSYAAYDLDGYTTDGNGYFLIGNASVPGVSIVFANNFLQNGADAVALYSDNASSFPNNTPVTVTNLLDALVYDTNDGDDAGLLVLLNNGEPQINEGGRGANDIHSMQRLPNGSGGARNTSTYDQTYPTPGAVNAYLDITWTGVTDTDWATATNWNPNIVPDIVTNAIIPDVTNDPVISTAAICKDISIAASAIVEVAPNGTLTVDGTLTNNAGATGLLVKSDGTSTGSLIHNTASVPATIERYVSAANWATASDGWHLLSSPVASQSISGDWTPAGAGNDYDLYAFDETKLNEYWLNQKVGANNITTFETGKGYLVAYEQSATKAFTGNVNVADVTLSGLTNTVGSAFPGWHLVGNPFASAIDYDLGTWTKTNIDAEIQVWNSAAASYQTATEVGGIVPSMNGFMAHTSGTGVLTIPADSRTHNAANWYKSDEEFILLKAKDIETGMSQSSIVRFNPMATDTYDADFDSYFLQGFAPAFYSANANEVYALNTLPEISNSLAIPFGFTKNGSTSFSIELAKSISGATIYLTDKKAGITTNLTEAGSYNFTASEGDDANRFTLHFGSVGIDDLNSSSDIDVYANSGIIYLSLQQNANATVKVYNLTGQLVLQSKTNGKLLTTLNASALNSGVYVVSVNSGDQVMSKKVVIRK